MKNDKFWWMVGVFMMSALVAFSLPAAADPRIEVNANNTFCHILNGNVNDTDDETFDGGCNPWVSANGGVATGYGKSEQSHIPASTVPHVFRYGVRESYGCKGKSGKHCSTRWRVTLTENDFADQACTLVDSNNTEYESNDWKTTIMWHDNGHLTQYIYCVNGAQQ